MLTIRNILSSDYDDVARIHKEGLARHEAPTHEWISNLCHNSPEGCFLAVQGGAPIGYVATHVAGSVGYVGPLSMVARHKETGEALLEAAVGYLTAHCSVVGIETSNVLSSRLEMYYRFGFRQFLPMRYMTKEIDGEIARIDELPSHVKRGTEIAAKDRRALVDRIRIWTDRIYPGLDLSRDILFFLEYLPDRIVLHLEDGYPRGFLAFHLPYKDDPWGAVEPGDGDDGVLSDLVKAIEAQCVEMQENPVEFHFHSSFHRLTDVFLECGHRFFNEKTCMILQTHRGGWDYEMDPLLIRPWWP